VRRPPARFARKLRQDLHGELGRAAVLDKLDRAVQIDVRPRGELVRDDTVLARADECLGTPALDPLALGLHLVQLGCGHRPFSLLVLLTDTFG
jgi:hypothetical protein